MVVRNRFANGRASGYGGASGYAADGRQYARRAQPGEVDYPALFEAMRVSRRVLERFRTERTACVRQYVGYHYSDGGSERRVPINHIARFVQVTARSLVPHCPRAMLATRTQSGRPAVGAMEDWLNKRMTEMHFEEVLRRWVFDSLFCIGIMKTGIGTPADAAVSGYVSPAGVPFAEVVDLDDFVCDIRCRDFRKATFIGHRYRIPLEVAEKLDYFKASARKKLSGAIVDESALMNQEGDDRIGVVGQGYYGGFGNADFLPMVDLWEIYIPHLRRVVTFASDRGGVPVLDAEPLREQEWLGPNCGPYHFLSLKLVPGNPMPGAPVQDLIDLHEFYNHGMRKLVNQMQRQKEVLPVRGGQVDDAGNLVQANDGDAFACDNADAIRAVNYGGPNPVNAQFTMVLGDLFNKFAGNLDLQSGAGPQSKTATQDKILAEAAGAGTADMQQHVITGISKVLDSLCWFWWYHPQEVMKTSKNAPGLDNVWIERNLYPGNATDEEGRPRGLRREGRYEDLSVRVDPYSLVYRTPQQRLQFLMMVAEKMMPMMPLLQQQGIMFDAMAYLKLIAKYADEPDIETLFSIAEPPAAGPGQPGGGVAAVEGIKPSSTTHEYTRRSEGRDTEANRGMEMMNDAAEFSANRDYES